MLCTIYAPDTIFELFDHLTASLLNSCVGFLLDEATFVAAYNTQFYATFKKHRYKESSLFNF